MTLENISPDMVFEMHPEKLWRIIHQLKTENNKNMKKETYDKILNGITLPIPIHHLTLEWYTIIALRDVVRVDGIGYYNTKEFMREHDERLSLMQKTIQECIENDDIIEMRV